MKRYDVAHNKLLWKFLVICDSWGRLLSVAPSKHSVRVCVCWWQTTSTHTTTNLSWQSCRQFSSLFGIIAKKMQSTHHMEKFGSIWMHCKRVKDPNSMMKTPTLREFSFRGRSTFVCLLELRFPFIYFSLSCEFSNNFVDVIRDLCVYRRLASTQIRPFSRFTLRKKST